MKRLKPCLVGSDPLTVYEEALQTSRQRWSLRLIEDPKVRTVLKTVRCFSNNFESKRSMQLWAGITRVLCCQHNYFYL